MAAADRYTYLPSVSLFVLAGAGVARLYERSSPAVRKALWGALLAILILLGQATLQQIKIWQDPEILWSSVINRSPDRAHLAHNNLGLIYDRQGLHDKAALEYEKAIALNPGFANAHYNLGLGYHRRGLQDKAILTMESSLLHNSLKFIDQAIIKAIAYSDIFDYPLTTTEIHRYLEKPASLEWVTSRLQNGTITALKISQVGPYYSLSGRENLVTE